jgi:hypothetical protein
MPSSLSPSRTPMLNVSSYYIDMDVAGEELLVSYWQVSGR